MFAFCQLNYPWDPLPTVTGTGQTGTSSTSVRPTLSSMGGATTSVTNVEAPHDDRGSGLGADEGHQGGSQATTDMDVDPPK